MATVRELVEQSINNGEITLQRANALLLKGFTYDMVLDVIEGVTEDPETECLNEDVEWPF